MTEQRQQERPEPISRWVHVVLGGLGVALGFSYDDAGIAAHLLVLGAVAYVAWTVRRWVGLLVALGAGMLELVHRAPSEHALVFFTPWLLAYVMVALVSSAIETATRPDTK